MVAAARETLDIYAPLAGRIGRRLHEVDTRPCVAGALVEFKCLACVSRASSSTSGNDVARTSTTEYTGPLAKAWAVGDITPLVGFVVASALYAVLYKALNVKK